MKSGQRLLPDRVLLAIGAGCALAIASLPQPARAQAVACPAGYGYSYGYGCVPIEPVYAAPVVAGAPPPVYDAFGITFGFGGGHHHPVHHDRGRHDPHHH